MSRRRLVAAVVVLFALAGCGSAEKAAGEPLAGATSASPSASASSSPSASPSPSPSPSLSPSAVAVPSVAIPPVPTMAAPPTGAGEEEPVDVYYANCTEAKRAGAAPLHRGEPGYRKALDRDGDGVACET